MKNLPARFIAIFMLLLLPVAVGACQKNGLLCTPTPAAAPTATQTVATISPAPTIHKSTGAVLPTETPEPSPTYFDNSELSFLDLPHSFVFHSGEGWFQTELHIYPDGSFTGFYFNSKAETGPDYPTGTLYTCTFMGRFTNLQKTGAYTYALTCEALSQVGKEGDTYLQAGMRYIVSTPLGLENATQLLLFLPGKKISELPEGFPDLLYTEAIQDGKLPYYGLYNAKDEIYFFSDIIY